jgi:hypothetical protein
LSKLTAWSAQAEGSKAVTVNIDIYRVAPISVGATLSPIRRPWWP